MPTPPEEGALEALNRKLYSRTSAPSSGIHEHKLPETSIPVAQEWHQDIPPQTQAFEPPKRRIPFLKWIVGGMFAFFLIVTSYGLYLVLGGSSRVSSDNVAITIAGPVTIPGGEPLTLAISVRNNNAVPLELADLLVEYPTGTRSVTDATQELPRYRESLGTIKSGDEVTRPVSALLFGEERSVQTVKVTVEYRLPNSNAIFYKESSYEVTISSSPLSLTVSAPEEHNSGQEIAFSVAITSNSTSIIKNVLLKAEYPQGFSFKSADPAAYADTNVWRLGDVKPGSKRTITIHGILTGEEGDSRVFRFETGLAEQGDAKTISIPFALALKNVAVNRPFITLGMTLDGSDAPEASLSSGKSVRVDIPYVNNLTEPVTDVEISVALSGTALNRQSVAPDKGFYQSFNDTVLWNSGTNPALASIPAGEGGIVTLVLSPYDASKLSSLRNPEINLVASVRGTHSLGGRVPEEVKGQVSRKIRIASDLQFSSRILHYSGPFKNTGPMPPKAEQDTTYTVTWAVGSDSNDVTDAKVSATLPPYVRFLGSVTPSSESVTFNQVGGVVSWDVGTVKAGTGFGNVPREVSFQIVFTPSITQVGTAPVLMNDSSFTAVDRFTGTKLISSKPPLSTRLGTDSGVKTGDEIVVK